MHMHFIMHYAGFSMLALVHIAPMQWRNMENSKVYFCAFKCTRNLFWRQQNNRSCANLGPMGSNIIWHLVLSIQSNSYKTDDAILQSGTPLSYLIPSWFQDAQNFIERVSCRRLVYHGVKVCWDLKEQFYKVVYHFYIWYPLDKKMHTK